MIFIIHMHDVMAMDGTAKIYRKLTFDPSCYGRFRDVY